MRAMPFRVASEGSVTFAEPLLNVGGSLISAGDPAPAWDYLTPATVVGEFEVDAELLRHSTGLDDLSAVSASVQVDCPQTGFRRVALCPVTLGIQGSAQIRLNVEPQTLAHDIEVRYGLLLTQPTVNPPVNMAAHRRGSRLYSHPKVFRFRLEGQGSGFPIEAFDFSRAGYPAGAAWRLNFRSDSLDSPFLGAVRLFVNTTHPQADTLLSGKKGLVQSILFHGVFEQMLLAVADGWEGEVPASFEEGTVGHVLDELVFAYLGRRLPNTVTALRGEHRADVLSKLQEATGFLIEAS